MYTLDLSSLTEDGEDICLNRDSEEVTGLFDENLGEKSPFSINLKVLPQGNFFILNGKINSSYQEDCCRCGYDIQLPLVASMNEMLIPDKDRPRKYQSSHHHETPESDEGKVSVTYIESLEFDLGAYLNEVIVMAREDYPKCLDKKICDSQMHKLEKAPEPKKEEGNALFAALQELKQPQ